MIKNPMLAGKCEDVKSLPFPVIVSEKIDGIRCLLTKDSAVSRNLKQIPNDYVRTVLKTWYNMYVPKFTTDTGIVNPIFDGELVCKDFNSTASGIMTKDAVMEFTYIIFDIQLPNKTFVERLRILQQMTYAKTVILLDQYTADTFEDVSEFEEQILRKGGEGIMIRTPDGVYKHGRSTVKEGYLLKLKRFVDSEAVITGFVEKLHNENDAETDALGYTKRSSHKENMVAANTLGSLTVKDVTTEVEFNVGSGFNDAQRLEIWNNQDKYLGKVITYRFFEIAKDKPRFPTFVCIREDM